MQGDNSHPLLQQTALSVNPFIDLPKAPTLPHNYASIPSTLPPSTLNAQPAANSDQPAYVTSSSGFAAHPSSIISQNKALLKQIEERKKSAEEEVRKWEQDIRDRELAEKRKKAPGYLDTEQYILQPQKAKPDAAPDSSSGNLMDEPAVADADTKQSTSVDDLGDAMDRAFGRSELG